jgi:hypothetical protein
LTYNKKGLEGNTVVGRKGETSSTVIPTLHGLLSAALAYISFGKSFQYVKAQ